jgi:hypothetical protein
VQKNSHGLAASQRKRAAEGGKELLSQVEEAVEAMKAAA